MKNLALFLFIGVCTITAPMIVLSCSTGNSTKANNENSQTDAPQRGEGRKPGGPQLGTPVGGPVIDKSGDATLQAMIKSEVLQFKQYDYTDAVPSLRVYILPSQP